MATLKFQRTPTKGLSEAQITELVEQNKGIYTEYYDPKYVDGLIDNIFNYINPIYFRSKLVGFDKYPTRNDPKRPLIFVSNHSGMAFPWDAMVFGTMLREYTRNIGISSIRPLVAPMLAETQLMNPYMVRDMWKRCGGIDATSLNFETAMHFGDADVLIYPEGVPGVGKGFDKKYQLQKFSSSFVRMSLKYQTDVIPIYSINGEYINPYSYKVGWINYIFQKIGIPFLPIGFLTFMIPFFPWIFYFGLPANLHFVMGKRIQPYKLLDKPFEKVTEEEIKTLTRQIQSLMQAEISVLAKKHGNKPYHWQSFFKKSNWLRYKSWFAFPPLWCFLFSEYERQYKQNPENLDLNSKSVNFFYLLRRNLFELFYFLPIIGWIPLAIRGYSYIKKPR